MALEHLLKRHSFEQLGRGIEVLLSLQPSREDKFLIHLDPERKKELEPTIEMILPLKHGAAGGDANLLEYAERKLLEAGFTALAMSYEEGLGSAEIQKARNRINSWGETVESLKGEEEPEEVGRFTEWWDRVQNWKRKHWGS